MGDLLLSLQSCRRRRRHLVLLVFLFLFFGLIVPVQLFLLLFFFLVFLLLFFVVSWHIFSIFQIAGWKKKGKFACKFNSASTRARPIDGAETSFDPSGGKETSSL